MSTTPPDRGCNNGRSLVYGFTVSESAYSLLRGQLRWFASRGWTVTLVATPDDASRPLAEREGIQFRGIRMERDISIVKDLHALREWIKTLRELRPYAVNLGTPKASLLGSLAAWILRVPRRLYVLRGLRLEGASGFLAAILWTMERLVIALATDVVVVSPSLAREAHRRRLVPPRKAWLIGHGSSNGVDIDAISARIANIDRRQLRRDLGFSDDAFVVGYVGRIASDKGIDTLLDSFRARDLNERAELLLIGRIENEYLSSVIGALGPRVHVIPWTSDLWGHLPALDVLCLPSLREGFPNVVLEAAAAGIPAVTTTATGAVDSVLDGETGFVVDMNDSSMLAARLNQFAADPRLLARMGAAAEERVREHFRPEHIWRGLESVLHESYDEAGLLRIDRMLEDEENR